MAAAPIAMPAGAAETVTRLLDLFAGGSTLPALAETGSGERFVLKLRATASGTRSLATEFLGNRIAAQLGLKVPTVRPLFVSAELPWEIGTDAFDETLQRSAGWNLGVAFLADAGPVSIAEVASLSRPFVAVLATVDDLLQNVDRTEKNRNLLRGADGAIYAIDFGGCLFFQRIIARRTPYRFGLPGNHLLAGRAEGSTGEREAVDPDRVADSVDGLPEEWLDGTGMTPAELKSRLRDYAMAYRQAPA
jgi:hypothetical protein